MNKRLWQFTNEWKSTRLKNNDYYHCYVAKTFSGISRRDILKQNDHNIFYLRARPGLPVSFVWNTKRQVRARRRVRRARRLWTTYIILRAGNVKRWIVGGWGEGGKGKKKRAKDIVRTKPKRANIFWMRTVAHYARESV